MVYEVPELQCLTNAVYQKILVETIKTLIISKNTVPIHELEVDLKKDLYDVSYLIKKMKEIRDYTNPFRKDNKKEPNEVCGVLYPEDIISDEEIAADFRAMRLGEDSR